MNKLTKKKMSLLSVLLLVGCCEEIDNKMLERPDPSYGHPAPSYEHHTVYPKPSGHVFVVNNTPHTRPQPLPTGYAEHQKSTAVARGRSL